MNEREFYRAVGEISDKWIIEAANPVKIARRIKVSKLITLAAVIIVLFGLTAFAVTITLGSRNSSSTNQPDYYSVPSPQTLQQDIGIAPNLVENFSNGYTFKSGIIADHQDYGKDHTLFESYKSLKCKYTLNDRSISLGIDSSMAGDQVEDDKTLMAYKGSKIKYTAYTNKCVPSDYELTEQDQKDQKSGKYVFSYGSSETEIYMVQGLFWEYGGLNYSLTTLDNNIPEAELIQMAKEIIDDQNGGIK